MLEEKKNEKTEIDNQLAAYTWRVDEVGNGYGTGLTIWWNSNVSSNEKFKKYYDDLEDLDWTAIVEKKKVLTTKQ